MVQTELDTIRVDVPVGRMLPEPREIEVSIDRDGAPLAIRLRLIPGKAEPAAPAPRVAPTPTRRERATADRYPYHDELGGSD